MGCTLSAPLFALILAGTMAAGDRVTGKAFATRSEVAAQHGMAWLLGGYGGYLGIRWDPKQKVFFGASESRKDGQAAGY